MNVSTRFKAIAVASLLSLATAGQAQSVQGPGNVDYVSGGVGLAARQALLAQAGQYNLHVEFAAAPEGEYLSEVEVKVADARGRSVLETRTDGPWLLAKLPAGMYSLTAKHAGTTRT